jgi:hypothetical protein
MVGAVAGAGIGESAIMNNAFVQFDVQTSGICNYRRCVSLCCAPYDVVFRFTTPAWPSPSPPLRTSGNLVRSVVMSATQLLQPTQQVQCVHEMYFDEKTVVRLYVNGRLTVNDVEVSFGLM